MVPVSVDSIHIKVIAGADPGFLERGFVCITRGPEGPEALT